LGNNAKTILSLVSCIAVAVGIVMKFGHGYRGTPPAWHSNLSLGLIGVGMLGIGVVVWLLIRKDRAPDFLRARGLKPLECSGLCFVPAVEVLDGVAFLTVHFQNRYSNPCIPTIELASRNPPWRLSPLEFAVDGAEYGVYRRALAIPANVRGRRIVLDIIGKNYFPGGRGRMLRFRDGFVVGRWSQSTLDVVTAVAAATGHIHLARTARIKIDIPSDARIVDDAEHSDSIESLWLPPSHTHQPPRQSNTTGC
jgi:hypothetical protein